MSKIYAIGNWRNNAELIEDAARLGYLDGHVLDATYGLGRFWKNFQPERFTACDLNPAKSPVGFGVDFTNMPFKDGAFDSVVLDPPYQLKGSGRDQMSDDYGVTEGEGTYVRWQDRHTLIRDGITECARVLAPSGYLLVKCQAQVCSGQVRWQDREFADHAESLGLRLVDRFDFMSERPQAERTRKDGKQSTQQHARRNHSTLLVFFKPKRRRSS